VCLLSAPCLSVPVRLQTQSQSQPLYAGLMDCVRKTYRTEGVVGFYRGVTSPLLGQMLFNAVQFMAYGKAKDAVAGREAGGQADLTIPQCFAAGALTGAAVAFIECPIDLFKTQLQTQIFQPNPRFSSLRGAVAAIVSSSSGVLGLYQGFLPTLLRNVPAVSCYFGVYEYMRRLQAQRKGVSVGELAVGEVLIAGAVGGWSYWLLTFPIDSVKSAIQADAIDRERRLYGGVGKAAAAMWREGGIRRFFKGLTPCLLRAAPANAVCFLLYEKTITALDAYF